MAGVDSALAELIHCCHLVQRKDLLAARTLGIYAHPKKYISTDVGRVDESGIVKRSPRQNFPHASLSRLLLSQGTSSHLQLCVMSELTAGHSPREPLLAPDASPGLR